MIDTVREQLSAVIGIPVTPFAADEKIDEGAYRAILGRTLDAGVGVVTPNGNTGEFFSLTTDERRHLVEWTMDEVGDALALPGVGLDLQTALADVQHYAQIGVQCVMVHQPVHPFWSLSGWVDYHQSIARAFPEMGIVPYLRSPAVDAAAMKNLIEFSPNVVGVKYAVADTVAFYTLASAVGYDRVAWICGQAESWAPAFATAGAVGFTSGLVNVDPKRSLRLFAALAVGDQAAVAQEWRSIQTFERLRARNSSAMNVSVVKEALAQLGFCSPRVRPPLSGVGQEDRDTISRVLQEWGLQESQT